MNAAFKGILARFTDSVEGGDGAAPAALFTVDGVYTDTFHGAFRGRPRRVQGPAAWTRRRPWRV